MTVSGQFTCPPAGSFVAVSGQFLVAANIRVKKPQLNEYVPDGLRAVQDYVTTELE
jgi:hypothetical protein